MDKSSQKIMGSNSPMSTLFLRVFWRLKSSVDFPNLWESQFVPTSWRTVYVQEYGFDSQSPSHLCRFLNHLSIGCFLQIYLVELQTFDGICISLWKKWTAILGQINIVFIQINQQHAYQDTRTFKLLVSFWAFVYLQICTVSWWSIVFLWV